MKRMLYFLQQIKFHTVLHDFAICTDSISSFTDSLQPNLQVILDNFRETMDQVRRPPAEFLVSGSGVCGTRESNSVESRLPMPVTSQESENNNHSTAYRCANRHLRIRIRSAQTAASGIHHDPGIQEHRTKCCVDARHKAHIGYDQS